MVRAHPAHTDSVVFNAENDILQSGDLAETSLWLNLDRWTRLRSQFRQLGVFAVRDIGEVLQ